MIYHNGRRTRGPREHTGSESGMEGIQGVRGAEGRRGGGKGGVAEGGGVNEE